MRPAQLDQIQVACLVPPPYTSQHLMVLARLVATLHTWQVSKLEPANFKLRVLRHLTRYFNRWWMMLSLPISPLKQKVTISTHFRQQSKISTLIIMEWVALPPPSPLRLLAPLAVEMENPNTTLTISQRNANAAMDGLVTAVLSRTLTLPLSKISRLKS